MRKRVLYVENDRRLTDSFQECLRDKERGRASDMEIRLVIARHMVEASQLLDKSEQPFDALIVDLMLPRNARDLSKLEPLERQRGSAVRQHFRHVSYGREAPDEDTISLRKHIDRLDGRIERYVAAEGGCELLERLARRRDPAWKRGRTPKPLDFPVVFLSARGLPEVKRRCEKLVSPRFYRFIEKPVLEEDVLRTLLELFAVPRR